MDHDSRDRTGGASDTAQEHGAGRRIAARLPDRDFAGAFTAFLQREGLDSAGLFAPKDDDELDSRLSRGEFDVVVFPDGDTLAEMILSGDARLSEWDRQRVAIRFASGEDRAFVDRVFSIHSRRAAAANRRRTVACLVLSVVALASLAVLLFLR